MRHTWTPQYQLSGPTVHFLYCGYVKCPNVAIKITTLANMVYTNPQADHFTFNLPQDGKRFRVPETSHNPHQLKISGKKSTA